VPGHPWTTGFFVLACIVTVIGTVWINPVNSLIGFAILLAGVPACLLFRAYRKRA
jgi:APA family basic amino acid/polyamine antiporter